MHPKLMLRKTLLLGLALLLAACSTAIQPKPNTLIAVRVGQVTSDSQAEVWANAPMLEIPTASVTSDSAPPGPQVTLQAVYDARQIAIRVEWADPSASVYKNAWTWDGSAFFRSGDEDRLIFHFPISNDPQFASKGCGIICHNQENSPDSWYMASDDVNFRYDQWHWKATRSNPIGQADDKWLSVRADKLDTSSGHYGDELISGGETPNENSRRNAPAFMNATDLLSSFILAGQESPLDMNALTSGMIIPGYILAPITGSRGDISASGSWADGKWVIVLVRAFDTGNEDDVTFIPPKPVPFGLAVTDNGSGYDHMVSQEVLTLEWK